MKLTSKLVLIFLLAVTSGAKFSVNAQINSTTSTASVPTTRILAIGHVAEGATREKIMPLMQKEVRDTLRLYLSGKLDQWYTRKDQNGVVFILNVDNVDEARNLLEHLPLGQAKLLQFDLIPLGPLSPLGLFLQEQSTNRQ